jgi:S1-C subfamily serine protease
MKRPRFLSVGRRLRTTVLLPAAVSMLAVAQFAGAQSVFQSIADVQPKMVKLYGAGGISGLEAYQSAFLISADGHVLTVWSYVLDTDYITAVLGDGRKYEAKLVGADPRLELAVLKIDETDLPHFKLEEAAPVARGARVLAFSNLFNVATGDEPSSVQHGVVSVRTQLDARRGIFETPYRGPVYVLDAVTNNPGAAGGALTNYRGELVGMLGKEMRNSQTNTWLNYAIPIDQLTPMVEDILSGKTAAQSNKAKKQLRRVKLSQYGLVMVPDVLERTPPFIEQVRPGSPAEKAGLKADDLIVFVGPQVVKSAQAVLDELANFSDSGPVKLVVMRGQELVEVSLDAPDVEILEAETREDSERE